VSENLRLDELRSAGRRLEISIEPLLPRFDEEGKHAEPIESLSMNSEQALQSKETLAMIRICIEQLPAQYREAIMLRDINELDTAEVATMLNITEDAVKIRLHRARQALMTLLTHAQKHHGAQSFVCP
jgi:RNA polymerase sigma-70 factor, ECF subfamily